MVGMILSRRQSFTPVTRGGGTLWGWLRVAVCILVGGIFFVGAPVRGDDIPVYIGVLAKRGPQRALQQWEPTAVYLTEQIPGYSFSIVPLDFKEINQAVEKRRVNFVLANPAIYVELEYLYGVNRIVTMENLRQGKPYTLFGGVIFCRAANSEIRGLKDLVGKTLMAVESNSFGGWHMAWRELQGNGINPYKDLAGLRFGGTHDAVVMAVLQGKVDVGTVRTDTLERMALEGKIDLADFRVIARHDQGQHNVDQARFPFLLSTQLYPEWPFAKVAGTSDELSKQVAVALLHMDSNHAAAGAASITGWTTPLSYQPVHDCLRELQIGPYAYLGHITLVEVIRQYRWWLVLSLALMLGMAAVTSFVLRLNAKLSQSRRMLVKARDDLELKVQERTADLRSLNDELRQEIGERRQAGEALRRANAELDQIFNTTADGMTLLDLDYNVLRVNRALAGMLELGTRQVVGQKCYTVFPSLRCGTSACPMHMILKGRELLQLEDEKTKTDGTTIPCIIAAAAYRNPEGELIGIVESIKDISERKRSELALAEYTHSLSQSNAELQQFAYVASHDLQEPLRMVASYVQLLARRYKGKLDSDADEFIGYAVDGANRMQHLIQDLLSYSRVQTRGKPFELVDCQEVLGEVLADLQIALEECNAKVTGESLPVVLADKTQIRQLLQNLVGNAVKFRGEQAPLIRVAARRDDGEWIFSVQDNGIGFESEYAERIFVIFQRLHGRQEYPGTGIGLAVSKKIVERHGGKIWVESAPGKGSTFYFSLPVREEEAVGNG